MNYQQLIETVSTILEAEKINKSGLTLEYNLDENTYNRLNQELFYKTNPVSMEYVTTPEFEVVIGGILVKIKKT
jgi:hypothetical protein